MYILHVDVFTDHHNLQYVFTQKDLNLRQISCLDLLKDYDMSILYHPDKATVVKDALNHMNLCSLSHIDESMKVLVKEVHRFARFGVKLEHSSDGGFMVGNNSESSLVVKVKSNQHLDKSLMEL